MKKFFFIYGVCLACCFAVYHCFANRMIGTQAGLGLCIGVVLLAAVLCDITTKAADGINIRLDNVAAFYGFFYGLYYVGSLVLFVFDDRAVANNIVEVCAFTLLGYIGWRLGIALAGGGADPVHPPTFDRRETRGLLILCWLGFVLVLAGYGYRASVGDFYTHGTDFVQETTLSASILNNVTLPFEFPIIGLSGLIGISGVMRKQAVISLWVFTSILVVIHLLAGEFRLIVTDVGLLIAVLQFGGTFRLTWRRLVAGGAVCLVMLLFIQVSRLILIARGREEIGVLGSVSLLTEALSASTSDRGYGDLVAVSTVSRGDMAPLFLSTVIDEVKAGKPYVYGRLMLHQLSILVPRALWPDKPSYLSPQLEIKRAFGLPEVDDAPGALTSYYAFGGPLGILFWLFIFGLFLGSLRRWLVRSNRALPWMVFIWAVSGVIVIEQDQMSSLSIALRHCIVAYVIFRLIIRFFPGNGSPVSESLTVGDRGLTES